MEVLSTRSGITKLSREWKRDGLVVGLVPTMGSFHDGHLYLMRKARNECDRFVVSIFVNPLQFGPSEDFASYPRDLDRDARLAEKEGCDALFAPTVEEMYPRKIEAKVSVPALSEGLCGRSRPGHFDGVATVVCKLFNIVQPDKAYFGRKDAQQLAVVRRMVADLDFPVTIQDCPTVREPDGLACSSRNSYLGAEARAAATCLFRGLSAASQLIAGGQRRADVLEKAVKDEIAAEPLAQLDYAELRDATTITKLELVPEEGRAILAASAYISNPGTQAGSTRLIDNFFITARGGKVEVDEGVVISSSSSAL